MQLTLEILTPTECYRSIIHLSVLTKAQKHTNHPKQLADVIQRVVFESR
mgnify:CR=1 FL=1